MADYDAAGKANYSKVRRNSCKSREPVPHGLNASQQKDQYVPKYQSNKLSRAFDQSLKV